jgi:hypothetical protein
MDRAQRLAPLPVQEAAILPAILAVRLDPAKVAAASDSAPAMAIVRFVLAKAVAANKFAPVMAIVPAIIVPATGRAAIGGRNIVRTR